MQTAKKAAESVKETAANIGASARSGMEKTKATVEEKVLSFIHYLSYHIILFCNCVCEILNVFNFALNVQTERMTAHDPMQKEMATEKKEERIRQAELEKREARDHNAASKMAATAPGTGGGGNYTTATYSTTGEYGGPMGGQQMSAMPGHGTGHPIGGNVTEGVAGSHPVGVDRGTGRTTAHHPHTTPGPGGTFP